MAASTALGRVQPIYRGEYNPGTLYHRLDNVYYEGNTYLCKVDSVSGITPAETSNYWQLVAHKGDQGDQGITGSFGTPTGSAEVLPSGSAPTIAITASGPDTAKIFSFDFGIPAGPVGYDEVAAEATSLSAGSPPTAEAELVTESGTTTLQFSFGIPSADGSGAQSGDGVTPALDPVTGLQDVQLTAVKYGSSQTLSEAQKLIARGNIGAQAAGDYIAEPSQASSGQFLQYSNAGEWEATTINLVPSGSSSDVGKYLRKTNSGMLWADVQSLPAGGAEGAPLIKNSVDNYDVTWGSFISSSEIDDIVDA